MNLVNLAFGMAAFGTLCLLSCAYGLWRICRQEKRLRNWRVDDAELAQHITKWTDELREEEL